jgi:hypothetical protein
MSFFSPRYGMTCDNVLNYEVSSSVVAQFDKAQSDFR